MKYVRLCSLVVGAFLLNMPVAHALSGAVSLPFAAAYTAPDGSECTHRGVDVALQEADDVTSPLSGTVSFAGRIPGPHGGSVLAVTLVSGDTKVTLLPLASVSVAKGATVENGDELGSVAASGDPSSPGVHVHLSERRGDVYVDPAHLLVAAPAAEPETEPEEAAAPSPVTAASPAGSQAPAAAGASAAAAPVTVGSGAAAPAGSAGRAGAPTGATAGRAAVQASTSHASAQVGASVAGAVADDPVSQRTKEIAPGVSIAPTVQKAAAPASVPAAASPVVRAAHAASVAAEPVVRFAAGHVALAGAVFAAVVFGVIVVVSRRAMSRRIVGEKRVSDRLGTMLQHLSAGDTLCRLTSCSGPLPSQSRGH